jgi:hypothetical protein
MIEAQNRAPSSMGLLEKSIPIDYKFAEVVKWQTHRLPFVFIDPTANPLGFSGYPTNSTV